MKFNTVGVFLTWFFLTLTAFRITRFITTDDLSEPFREWVYKRTGKDSSWSTLVGCNWCAGAYICAPVFAAASLTMDIPLPILQTFSAMAVTGFVGNYDD